MYKITKLTKHITDDGKEKTIAPKPEGLDHKFRLLDGDGIIYAYGYSNTCDDDNAFSPLDDYENAWGVVQIDYKNQETGEWEML